MRIGINGFGRIGRIVFRIAFERTDLEVVHINDVGETRSLASLLQFDSTHGRFHKRVKVEGEYLHVDGSSVSVSAERDPSRVPWADRGVDVVLESTGKFRTKKSAQDHLAAGAKKVLISAPAKDELDGSFIIGINEELYDRDRHDVISIGSCTTNCLAPLVSVLHKELGIEYGLINTVHAYTASQNLLDGPHASIRRGRAAAENLVPTTTGASEMIGQIIPELQGKLRGLSVRVPVKCGSLLDLTCTLAKDTSAEEVNDLFRKWAEGRMKGILLVEDEALVSSDIIGTKQSAIVSAQDTTVVGARLLKVLAWYDNEWAFSQRCVDMMARML